MNYKLLEDVLNVRFYKNKVVLIIRNAEDTGPLGVAITASEQEINFVLKDLEKYDIELEEFKE